MSAESFEVIDGGESALGLLPPQNLEAEQSVLGAILLGVPDDSPVWALRPDDFYRAAHERLYEVFGGLRDRGVPVDLVTAAEELRVRNLLGPIGGAAYLCSLMETVPTAANAPWYAGIVAEKARDRREQAVASAHVRAVSAGGEGRAESRRRLVALLSEPAPTEALDRTARERLAEIVLEATSREEDVESLGIKTGFAGLDAMTNGFQPGDCWLIAARPSMGKTALACSIVQHVVKSERALFLSAEQNVDAIWGRLLSQRSGIPKRRITNARLRPDEAGRLREAWRGLDESGLTLEYCPGISGPEATARIRRAAGDEGARVVVVDHVGLLDRGGREPEHQRMGLISRQLTAAARETGVTLISLVQLNRAMEGTPDKRPTLSSLAQTGEHERNADFVCGLYRPAYYEREKPAASEAQECELIVLKAREGETGTQRIYFTPDRTWFCDPPKGYGYV